MSADGQLGSVVIRQLSLLHWCPCRINHTVILEDPFDDPSDLPVPDRSPEPTKEQLDVSIASLTWTCMRHECW